MRPDLGQLAHKANTGWKRSEDRAKTAGGRQDAASSRMASSLGRMRSSEEAGGKY